MIYDRGRGAALADFNEDGLAGPRRGQPRRAGPRVAERRRGIGQRPRRWATGSRSGSARPAATATPSARSSRRGPRRGTARREIVVGGGHIGGQLGWTHVGLGSRGPTADVRVIWPDGDSRALDDRRGRRVRRDRAGRGRADAMGPVSVSRTMTVPRLATVGLPDFGMPGVRPKLPPASLRRAASRRSARARMPRGYDRLVVYADREHSANLAFLTGFDPRFEEAMLVARTDGRPGDPRRQRVLGDGRRRAAARWTPAVPGPQPAEPAARPVAPAARDPRRRGDRARAAGRRHRLEDLREPGHGSSSRRSSWTSCAALVGGERARARTPTDLLIDPADGLRIINDVDQLAVFEHAACRTSDGVRALFTGLRARADASPRRSRCSAGTARRCRAT